MSLRPLHPVYFLVGLIGFLIEGVLFLCLTWLLDRGIKTLNAAWMQRG